MVLVGLGRGGLVRTDGRVDEAGAVGQPDVEAGPGGGSITYEGGITFSVPLVADKQMEFWSGMELSRKVVTRVWFQIFALVLVAFLPKVQSLDMGTLLTLLTGMLGLGVLRTKEKLEGVTR